MYRDLLKKIEGELDSFSKGQRAISNYILQNYDKAAYMTAAAIGKQAGVSESTVVRFATELGFKGYPELQRALQEVVRINLTSVQRVQLTNSIIGDGDILTKIVSADAEKIRQTLDEIDRESFDRTVDKLIAAKNIYILGARGSAFLAGFLDYNLGMIFNNVRIVRTGSGVEMFEQLFKITEGDVLFAISFPRYSTRVVNVVKYARDKGAEVIAMTDGVGSPIAKNATECLVAKSEMVSFVDSLAAPISVINALLVAIVRKKEKEFSEKLLQLEEIWDEYHVYDKNR